HWLIFVPSLKCIFDEIRRSPVTTPLCGFLRLPELLALHSYEPSNRSYAITHPRIAIMGQQCWFAAEFVLPGRVQLIQKRVRTVRTLKPLGFHSPSFQTLPRNPPPWIFPKDLPNRRGLHIHME